MKTKTGMEKLWYIYTKKAGLLSDLIYSSAVDLNGNLWFGCKNPNGVCRFDGEKWETFDSGNSGLGNGHIWDIEADENGNLWFATHGGGLSCYDGNKWKTYTKKDGLASNYVYAVKSGPDNKIWCGCAPKPDLIISDGGLSIFDGKQFEVIRSDFTFGQYVGGGNSGLCDNKVYAVTFDREDNVWLGTKGNGVCLYDGQSWKTFNSKSGFPADEVGDGAAACDREGNIWFGTRGRGTSKFTGTGWETYSMKNGLAGDFVYSIRNGPDGNIWFGCSPNPKEVKPEGGISIFNGTIFKNYTSDYSGGKYTGGGNSPLSDNRVYTILFDKRNNGWFGTKGGGITCLSAEEIKKKKQENCE